MAEQEELLQAVLDNPDDDAPRLAYADWCEQQSDEPTKARADFIRLQVGLAHIQLGQMDGGTAYSFQHRENMLTDRDRFAWAGRLATLVDDFAFNRGFIELVTLTAAEFLERAAQLFSAAPIRHLNLWGVRDIADRFFASEHLRGIHSLGLDRCALGDEHLRLLAASPELTQLRWLSLSENDIGLDGADALATSPFLKQLEYVNFLGNRVDPGEVGGQDGSVIVATWLPEAGQTLEGRHGHLPWLHRTGATIFDFHPSRFRL